jgi:FixJ family two-component response regulator
MRGHQVLAGIMEEQSNKVMARRLGLHAKTIEFHGANPKKNGGRPACRTDQDGRRGEFGAKGALDY